MRAHPGVCLLLLYVQACDAAALPEKLVEACGKACARTGMKEVDVARCQCQARAVAPLVAEPEPEPLEGASDAR